LVARRLVTLASSSSFFSVFTEKCLNGTPNPRSFPSPFSQHIPTPHGVAQKSLYTALLLLQTECQATFALLRMGRTSDSPDKQTINNLTRKIHME
jgi:hypothetical protein